MALGAWRVWRKVKTLSSCQISRVMVGKVGVGDIFVTETQNSSESSSTEYSRPAAQDRRRHYVRVWYHGSSTYKRMSFFSFWYFFLFYFQNWSLPQHSFRFHLSIISDCCCYGQLNKTNIFFLYWFIFTRLYWTPHSVILNNFYIIQNWSSNRRVYCILMNLFVNYNGSRIWSGEFLVDANKIDTNYIRQSTHL